ncbi:MAG: glutathione synthase, partial [Myxococcota bacterium]
TKDKDSLKTFINNKGKQNTVIKPLSGTRGRNVFRLNPVNDANHNQIIEILREEGYIIAQEFLPEAKAGDTRVIVINGKILEHQGKVAAIRRLPSKGDFRSNLHAGGTAKPAKISVQMRKAVELAKPKLLADGLFMVGIDFIGDKIIELNVFSPGGFRDAERFGDFSFSTLVIETAVKMVEKKT